MDGARVAGIVAEPLAQSHLAGQVEPCQDHVAVADRQNGPNHIAQPHARCRASCSRAVAGRHPLRWPHRAAIAAFAGEEFTDQPFLVGTLRERWQLDGDAVESIVEILSKGTPRDHASQVLMRCAHHAQVDFGRCFPFPTA